MRGPELEEVKQQSGSLLRCDPRTFILLMRFPSTGNGRQGALARLSLAPLQPNEPETTVCFLPQKSHSFSRNFSACTLCTCLR